ncbi:MAG: carbohydrate kinase [Spirochaetales bacterium]|nr:carbohydrate kinase [Spirochaetales bacterium]
MKKDITMIGHISRDIMIYKEDEVRLTGGPVIYSSAAAVKSGKSVQVITRASEDADRELDGMRDNGVEVIRLDSEKTTSIENIYFTADKEKRQVTLLSRADPFTLDSLPEMDSSIYHLAGLFRGEIPDNFIPFLSEIGEVAIDAQGLLRCSEDGKLLFRDWEVKKELLPLITYLKTDAAEAEILTGESDREKAAKILASWGAKEVMVTHNTEVLILSEGNFYRGPFTPSNLSGRTGRGDTTFAAYLARRLDHSPDDAVKYAAALCSIKMENPGPFSGTMEDVLKRIKTDNEATGV